MSEKSLYLEEDYVFEFREKRDLIQILNLKVITYYLLLPILSNRFLTLIIKRKKWEYVVGSSLTCRRKMQKRPESKKGLTPFSGIKPLFSRWCGR